MREHNRRALLKSGLLSVAGLAGLPSLSTAVQAMTTAQNRPKLKITEIRTAEVRVHGYQVHIRVYTDGGIIGQWRASTSSSACKVGGH